MTAPSVNEGIVGAGQGLQVNGASGAENAFTVDGIVTNSLINGQSRQNTVFEYLQEETGVPLYTLQNYKTDQPFSVESRI